MLNYKKVWTTLSLEEKLAFRDRVIAAVQEIYPHYIVRPLEPGDGERFFVGNKQDDVRVTVPLRDLYVRFSTTAGSHEDLKETIFLEYASTLNRADDAALAAEEPDFAWSDIRERVRLQHVRLNELPDGKLHYPFGDEVVSAFVVDDPDHRLMYWITQEMIDAWEQTQDELFRVSMDNLSTLADGLELAGIKTPHD